MKQTDKAKIAHFINSELEAGGIKSNVNKDIFVDNIDCDENRLNSQPNISTKIFEKNSENESLFSTDIAHSSDKVLTADIKRMILSDSCRPNGPFQRDYKIIESFLKPIITKFGTIARTWQIEYDKY